MISRQDAINEAIALLRKPEIDRVDIEAARTWLDICRQLAFLAKDEDAAIEGERQRKYEEDVRSVALRDLVYHQSGKNVGEVPMYQEPSEINLYPEPGEVVPLDQKTALGWLTFHRGKR